jgi:hypothetical protein
MRTSFVRQPHLESFARLCALADGQWGQVGLSQLSGTVPDKVLKQWATAGIVEPVADGVIRVCAGGRHPHPAIYAAWLRAGSKPAWERSTTTLVVSHRTAVQLYGAGELAGEQLEFTGRAPEAAGVVVHSAVLSETDCVVIEGLPVTSPARTLADLAVDEGFDVSDLGRVARSMLAAGWTTAEELGPNLTAAFTRRGLPRDGVEWLATALDAAQAG